MLFDHILFEQGHEKTCLMSYANNKGADQPAHPRSLISAFVVHCLDSVMYLVSVTKISSIMLSRPVWVWPGRKLQKTRFLVTRLIYMVVSWVNKALQQSALHVHLSLLTKTLHLSLTAKCTSCASVFAYKDTPPEPIFTTLWRTLERKGNKCSIRPKLYNLLHFVYLCL